MFVPYVLGGEKKEKKKKKKTSSKVKWLSEKKGRDVSVRCMLVSCTAPWAVCNWTLTATD